MLQTMLSANKFYLFCEHHVRTKCEVLGGVTHLSGRCKAIIGNELQSFNLDNSQHTQITRPPICLFRSQWVLCSVACSSAVTLTIHHDPQKDLPKPSRKGKEHNTAANDLRSTRLCPLIHCLLPELLQ